MQKMSGKKTTMDLMAVLFSGLFVLVGSRAYAGDGVIDIGGGGPQSIGLPSQVVLGDLPQAAPTYLAAQPTGKRPMRPLNGMTDSEWYGRSKLAGQRGGIGALSATPVEGAVPAGAEAGALTPGATKSLVGLDEATAGFWTPSDMGLAVGSTYVVQVVNEAITVMDKNGVVQAGF